MFHGALVFSGSNGIDLGYGPLTVEKRKPSAANKDPVSLLNEYAQKHKVMVSHYCLFFNHYVIYV